MRRNQWNSRACLAKIEGCRVKQRKTYMHINNGIAVMREFHSKDGISGDTQTKLESLTDAALITLDKPEIETLAPAVP